MLIETQIIRVLENKFGTFGVFAVRGNPICVTLEKRWLGNERNVSCIPVGTYEAEPFVHDKFGQVYHVLDVPGRSQILIHPANLESELQGCIAPGLTFSHNGVFSSRDAMKRLFQATGAARISLEITRAY